MPLISDIRKNDSEVVPACLDNVKTANSSTPQLVIQNYKIQWNTVVYNYFCFIFFSVLRLNSYENNVMVCKLSLPPFEITKAIWIQWYLVILVNITIVKILPYKNSYFLSWFQVVRVISYWAWIHSLSFIASRKHHHHHHWINYLRLRSLVP